MDTRFFYYPRFWIECTLKHIIVSRYYSFLFLTFLLLSFITAVGCWRLVIVQWTGNSQSYSIHWIPWQWRTHSSGNLSLTATINISYLWSRCKNILLKWSNRQCLLPNEYDYDRFAILRLRGLIQIRCCDATTTTNDLLEMLMCCSMVDGSYLLFFHVKTTHSCSVAQFKILIKYADVLWCLTCVVWLLEWIR